MAAQNLLLFFRALACNPRSVGAIAPSGANLASLITSEITAASGPVLELGPGTGVFTEALLQARFPRARVLWMDAAWMASHDLFEHPLGAVVSGLPLLNFAPKKVAAILTAAFSKLRDGGSFYQFTYGMQCPVSKAQLDELGLKANCMGRVLLNVPPASVYRITRIKPVRLADQVEPDAV